MNNSVNDNVRYSSKLQDMAVLMQMKVLANVNGGVARCIMECRQLAGEVSCSPPLLDKLACIDDWLCRFSSVMYDYSDKEQIQWRASLEKDYPRETVYLIRPGNEGQSNNQDDDKKPLNNKNTTEITVSVTIGKHCASQEEVSTLYELAEKLKSHCPGN